MYRAPKDISIYKIFSQEKCCGIKILKEISALLEEAGIEHKGLFLNADAGFDSKSLREFLESREIVANIKPNPRNGEQPDVYFNEELYKKQV